MMCRNRAISVAGIAATTLFALTLGGFPAFAQDAQPPTPPPPDSTAPPTDEQVTPLDPTKATALSQVAPALSRQANIVILADKSVAHEMVMPPAAPIRADNVEQVLTQIAKSLPAGTVWVKVYLPSNGEKAAPTRWNADTVANYVIAQQQLFGAVGEPTPDGTIEIMGKKLSGTDASTLQSMLNLKPVYLLMNPTHRDNLAVPPANGQPAPVAAPNNPPPDNNAAP